MDDELLQRYLDGKATNQEKEEILAWLDSDPENHIAQLNELHYINLAVDVFCDPDKFKK